jgi:hypothetical protein
MKRFNGFINEAKNVKPKPGDKIEGIHYGSGKKETGVVKSVGKNITYTFAGEKRTKVDKVFPKSSGQMDHDQMEEFKALVIQELANNLSKFM